MTSKPFSCVKRANVVSSSRALSTAAPRAGRYSVRASERDTGERATGAAWPGRGDRYHRDATARRFARPGLALAFRSERTGEVEYSVIVGGEASEAHDTAFAEAQKRSARKLVLEPWESALEVASSEVAPAVLETAPTPRETQELEEIRSEAVEQRDLRAHSDDVAQSELQELRRRLDEAKRREQAALEKLASISVRQVEVYEHRDYLERALRESRKRTLIVSPWINARVVNSRFSRLRRLLDRGVELYIGYGVGDDPRRPTSKWDRQAEGDMKRLASQHHNFHLCWFGDTHAKVLLSDSAWCVIGSLQLAFVSRRSAARVPGRAQLLRWH